jgi:hypothetical protein
MLHFKILDKTFFWHVIVPIVHKLLYKIIITRNKWDVTFHKHNLQSRLYLLFSCLREEEKIRSVCVCVYATQ